MTTILDRPVRVDERGERLYFNVPGEVCVDVCSGREEDRKTVLAFLAQAQEMAWALRPLVNAQCEGMADCGGHRGGLCPPCRARYVLRAAGVEVS